ncbi:uncharacterized protein Dana_GF14272 [Drosophila ananassae]|uniref:EMI domain-containing protein n=1 Tax=Drosophila ananassae TaxID=7217 RepID=B3MMZ9_DROAN|nr:uncharacterized protein LOC6497100 isoform X1 [Drosophila ananassae]EDV31977.1 uncharacterized protein Dana_GF14272 [Drosophila ananassae]
MMAQRWSESLILWLALWIPLGSTENSSLRVNTNVKDIEAGARTLASIQGPGNICIREEPYVEQIQIPEMQPVRVRTSSWCMEIPPRCATYKTEMREVMRVQKLNKTRTVRFCCQGYEGNLSDSQATCKPICRGGCGRGSCVMPEICSCEEGYVGKHCTQRCDHDRWGLDCKNICQCQNGAACDNKSGICHCLAGWAGQFCEQPCPQGTHGIMCRKVCDCDEKPCNPQTGACILHDHQPELNVSHVIVETVNSTLEKMGIIPRPVTPSPLPEVIVIKQPAGQEGGHHTPKIIVHQSGSELLENLHTSAAGIPAPEVIHVITNGITSPQEHLAGFSGLDTNTSQKGAVDPQTGVVTTLVVIMLLLLFAIAAGTLYVFRRYHHKDSTVYNSNGVMKTQSSNPEVILTEASALGKNFHEPLPEPPIIFAVSPQSNDAPAELYDTPSNNSSIKTPPYAYARKESLYSVITPKSRKGSLDSHLYDEIRYHQQHHHQHHQQHQQRSHQGQHSTTASAFLPARPPSMPLGDQFAGGNHQSHQRSHHVTHLIIPPQNANFLQVPAQITAKRIAHL